MTRLFELPPADPSLGFPDISKGDPGYQAIEAAGPFMNRQVLCFGCALSKAFFPAARLTRADSIVFLVRVLVEKRKLELLDEPATAAALAGVADARAISPPARAYFATALRGDVVKLVNATFEPSRFHTRADMAVLLDHVQQRFAIARVRNKP